MKKIVRNKLILMYSCSLLFIISCFCKQPHLGGILAGFILGFMADEAFFVHGEWDHSQDYFGEKK